MSSFIDRRCLSLLQTINSYHSVEFSQSLSNEYSLITKKHAPRVYPKGCGRQILTKEKDANNNEKSISYIANTIINGIEDEEEINISSDIKLETKHFLSGKCTGMDSHITSNLNENKSSTLEFPSISKDSYALKQRNECQPNAAVFNRMEANDKILDNIKVTSIKNLVEFHNEAASKVNSIDDTVVSTLQENNDTIDEVAIIKPELQVVEEAKELATKKKRKMENQYVFVPVKKRRNDFLVDDNNNTIVSFNPENGDFVTFNKVLDVLKLFQVIYKRVSSPTLAHTEFVGRYGKFNQGIIGKIPGVEIGDKFHFRAEMNIVGLHCQLVAGIDYIKEHGTKIAISVVSSNCRYTDQRVGNDILMYSGTGGTFEKGQQFEGRNLALKNSIGYKIPIRVIHGHTGLGKKTYVYDGLFLVEGYTIENSKLMFQLRRIPDQAQIEIKGLEILQRPKLPNIPLCDISNGKEDKPIKVVNNIDAERYPAPFTYITKSIYPSLYTTTKPICCDCVDGCSDAVKCACVIKNGGSLAFNSDGALLQCKPLVYECGPDCKCLASCENRVSQHGIKFPLEVFKTKFRGWGVRSSSFIPSGSFICEYVGEILDEEDAGMRTNDEYLFAIGSNYHDKSLWDDVASSIPSLQKDACCDFDVPLYSIDALKYGNAARFINHSCTPNLVAQELLYDNDDIKVPRIMLFAGEDIQPNQELTYDYNYNVDQVHDMNGDLKKKECHCGSFECDGWLY